MSAAALLVVLVLLSGGAPGPAPPRSAFPAAMAPPSGIATGPPPDARSPGPSPASLHRSGSSLHPTVRPSVEDALPALGGSINVGGAPSDVAFDGGNGLVYVANEASDNVSVIDGTTVIASVPDPPSKAPDPPVPSERRYGRLRTSYRILLHVAQQGRPNPGEIPPIGLTQGGMVEALEIG
ncbi:MAG TPA: hypothetical protein VLY85_03850 [Thermoplasmata archaeon]|nr:hypothetical protein [Thermoplasmata archaeon]